MQEQKLFEGVYFTDYRQSADPVKQGSAVDTKAGPAHQQFVTLEQLQQEKDPAQMAYLLSAVIKRQEWLLESTSFLLEDRELWADQDVVAAIDENVPLITKYAVMLAWITETPERCHATTKEDLEKVAKLNLKADETKKLYQEFECSRGLLV
jgi:hypothetical protein